MKVDKVANMKVDMVAGIEVDLVVGKVVNRVAHIWWLTWRWTWWSTRCPT